MNVKFETLLFNFLKKRNLINPDKSIKEMSYEDNEAFRELCLNYSKSKRENEIDEMIKEPKIKKKIRKVKLKQIEGEELNIDDKILLQLLNKKIF